MHMYVYMCIYVSMYVLMYVVHGGLSILFGVVFRDSDVSMYMYVG